MLGLGEQVQRQRPRVGILPEDDQQLARAGEAVNSDAVAQLALGLLDPRASGSHDHIDRIDRLRAQRERGDRVSAAEPVDLVDPAEHRRGENHRMGVAVRSRRADDHDLADACSTCRGGAHHDGAGVRRTPTGRVDGSAANGYLAQAHTVALRQLHVTVLGESGARHGVDVGDRDLQRPTQVGAQRRQCPRRFFARHTRRQ